MPADVLSLRKFDKIKTDKNRLTALVLFRNVFLHKEIIVSCHYDSWHCSCNTTNYWFEWPVGSCRWESTIRYLNSYLHPNSMPKYASQCTGGYILKFQNSFLPCDDIVMEIKKKLPLMHNLDEITSDLWTLTLWNLHHTVFHKIIYELLIFPTFIGSPVIVW